MLKLIEDPPFLVEYNQFNPPQPTISLVKVIERGGKFLIDIIEALGKAIKTNLASATRRFAVVVIRAMGDEYSNNRHIAVIAAVFIWAIYESIQLISMTSYFYQQKHPRVDLNSVKKYAGKINLAHLKTQGTELDTSQIPAHITVDHLLILFDQINFTDPQEPAYINPDPMAKKLIDDGKKVLPTDLRAGLQTLIANIRSKKAIVGTPPAASPMLDIFYNKLEDLIRYNLWIVLTQKNPEQAQNKEDRIECLVIRANLALDLARAGRHCGARYMGEAVQAYTFLKANEKAVDQLSIQAKYYNMLANTRLKIAQKQIAALGTNTHTYAAYMSELAGPLGLPGVKNVVEFLGTFTINSDRALQNFFNKYNSTYILKKTIKMIHGKQNQGSQTQEAEAQRIEHLDLQKVHGDQEFKELVYDWMKEQIGDWGFKNYQELGIKLKLECSSLTEKLFAAKQPAQTQIVESATELTSACKKANLLIHIFKNLEEDELSEFVQNLKAEEAEDMDRKHFVCILFLLNKSKLFPKGTDGIKPKREMANSLTSFAPSIIEALQTQDSKRVIAILEQMQHKALLEDQANEILRLCYSEAYQIPVSLEGISDCFTKDDSIQALESYIDLKIQEKRKQEFLDKLHTPDHKQLKKEAIEWFMLAQQVITEPI